MPPGRHGGVWSGARSGGVTRAAVYDGNRRLEIEDVPEPTAGEGQVIGLWFALRGVGLIEIDVVEPSPTRRRSIETLGARTLDPVPRERRIQGTSCYTGDDYRAVIDLMAQGHYDTKRRVDTVPLSSVIEHGFEPLRAGRKMKLLVDPAT